MFRTIKINGLLAQALPNDTTALAATFHRQFKKTMEKRSYKSIPDEIMAGLVLHIMMQGGRISEVDLSSEGVRYLHMGEEFRAGMKKARDWNPDELS